MRILGIDPGIATTGFCILDGDSASLALVSSGSIQTEKNLSETQRLTEVYNDMVSLIKKYEPDILSIERLFYCKNQKTVMSVAHARGVILLAAAQAEIPVFEYPPMVVKQVITGYGKASKDEVKRMVQVILGADSLPKLDDTVDSIAIAICHLRSLNEVKI